ncbi:MAG: hypothetical protein HYZ27_05795, partial [Deltaproteobacteria bacterium]|nr:hypothetical protein [Deltaproteobacteria bacterium]
MLPLILALAGGSSCKQQELDLSGWACDNGTCTSRYVCHPETNLCVVGVTVDCADSDAFCPLTTATGDSCPSEGSFLPCSDAVRDCSEGCRTCNANLTWSACSSGCAPTGTLSPPEPCPLPNDPPGVASGSCVEGACAECLQAADCTSPPTPYDCFVIACANDRCNYAPDPGRVCAPQSCSGGFTSFERLCGDGSCPAPNPASASCGAYVCNSSGTACLTSCTDSSDCAGGGECFSDNTCAQPLDVGEPCQLDNECLGNACVDGYCCNAACTGTCQRCDTLGQEGTCLSDATLCTGNCAQCSSGSCVASVSLCTGNCDQCSGGGTTFNCAANGALCTGNCDVCTGGGTAFDCAASAGLCGGDCVVCSGGGTNYSCAADPGACLGDCATCSGGGATFNCAADETACAACDNCVAGAGSFDCAPAPDGAPDAPGCATACSGGVCAAGGSYSEAPAAPINDNVGDALTCGLAGAAVGTIVVADMGTLVDVNIGVDITHTYDGDVDIWLELVNGNGTFCVELSTDNGADGDNFTGTLFDDEGATAITTGAAPFSGGFRPEGALSALDGQPMNGTWRLYVSDD